MAYTIPELINRQTNEIKALIDLTLSQQGQGGTYRDGDPDPAMTRYISTPFYTDPIFAWMKIREYRPIIANVRGNEGEVLVERDRFELTQEEMGSFNVSSGVTWTADDYALIDKLNQLVAMGGRGSEAYRRILDHFRLTPAALTERVIRTWIMLAMRVATIGKTSYRDPKSGVLVSVDYTAQVPNGNLAATLTGNARWSQLATATPITNLADHLNAYFSLNFRFPAAIAMSRSMADNLRNAADTKTQWARFRGLDTATTLLPTPTMEDVRTILSWKLTTTPAAAVPEFIVTDAIYYSVDTAGTRTSAPFIPADYYVFLDQGFVEAARVPTLTEKVLGAPATQGIALVNRQPQQDIPVRGSLLVDSAGMILVPDARRLASRNVENTAIA